MNPATEILLRWFYSDRGLEDDLADELVEVLKVGCAALEPDSIKAVADFVEQARSCEKTEPYGEIVRIALLIHDEMGRLDVASANLDRFLQIDRLLRAMPASPIGRRVIDLKVKSLVSELVG